MSAWSADRAAGIVTLVILTASLSLGVASALRATSPSWPRWATATLHRNLALLALAFGVVHAGTAVLDNYVDIRLTDVLVPFAGHVRPFWLGLGAIGTDLMLAVLVTSAVRRRIGPRAWKAVHRLAYGAWGFGFLHAVGEGTDARTTWGLALLAAVAAVGTTAILLRLQGPPEPARRARAAGPPKRLPRPAETTETPVPAVRVPAPPPPRNLW